MPKGSLMALGGTGVLGGPALFAAALALPPEEAWREWLIVLAVVFTVGGLALMLAAFWRKDANKPTAQITQRDHGIGVIGDASISIGPPSRDLSVPRGLVNEQIETGRTILERVRGTKIPSLVRDFETVHRPEIADWHTSNSHLVSTHFGAIRGRYSIASTLVSWGDFVDRTRTTQAPGLFRREIEGFLESRINELRDLLLWDGR